MLWTGFLAFVAWTMIVLALSAVPGAFVPGADVAMGHAASRSAVWQTQGQVHHASVSAVLTFGSSLLLGWVWLLTAGLAYVVRPDGIAARAFARWATLVATMLITICDFHTTRRLVPAYFMAYALMQSALLEFVLYSNLRRTGRFATSPFEAAMGELGGFCAAVRLGC